MSVLSADLDAQRLRSCLSDLVALSTMSSWWIGRSSDEIAESLGELLVNMLRVDAPVVELAPLSSGAPARVAAFGSGSANRYLPPLKLSSLSGADGAEPANRQIAVPIGIGGELGHIVVASHRADFPDELEMLAMEVTANQVAVALRYARLLRRHEHAEEHLSNRAAEQAVVARLGLRALDGITLEETLIETVTALRDTSGADASAVLEQRYDDAPTVLRAAVGWDSPRHLDAQGFISGRSVVIQTRGGRFGVLSVHSRRPREFTEDDVDFQQALANLIAVAIDRDRAEAERRELLARTAAAQATAERASRVKSDFLGMMSHELRTPLNAIGGYAELLEEHVYGPTNEEQRAVLARIRRAQKYLLSLINSVLSSLKLGSGQMRFDIADVALDHIIATVEELISPQLVAKRIDFRTSMAARGVHVRADEEKVQQIVLNLVTNATKFTEPGGQIWIECNLVDDFVRLHVMDTGCGIEAERLASVFEPFVQVQGSASRGGEGTGLGLAISHDLAVGMGGWLEVQSEVGVGSTFTLTLPRHA